MAKAQHHEKPLAQNKKARHDYRIVSTIEAGIALTGTEIKSVRASRVTLKDGFAQVRNGEVWLMNVHIAQYAQGNRFNHDELRTGSFSCIRRKLPVSRGNAAEGSHACST